MESYCGYIVRKEIEFSEWIFVFCFIRYIRLLVMRICQTGKCLQDYVMTIQKMWGLRLVILFLQTGQSDNGLQRPLTLWQLQPRQRINLTLVMAVQLKRDDVNWLIGNYHMIAIQTIQVVSRFHSFNLLPLLSQLIKLFRLEWKHHILVVDPN